MAKASMECERGETRSTDLVRVATGIPRTGEVSWLQAWTRFAPDNLASAFALILVVSSYYRLLGLKVYGFDEVHYYSDFTFKLREEGRWINFLLHDFLQHIPLQVHAALYVALAWLLLFRFARNLSCDKLYAILVASALLVSPPFVYQSLWPASLLPSLVGLLGMAWLVRKGVSYRAIYLIGGILLFGGMQNFYFLMPLLFIGQIEQEPFTQRKFLLRIWNHALYWVAGSIVGFLVALLAVYLLIGQVGIVPATWRKTMPVHDLHDVVRNVSYVLGCMRREADSLVMLMTGRSAVYAVGFLALVALRLRSWRLEFRRAVTLVAVGVSFFAFSVPLAPVIQTRSLVALSVALILLMLVPGDVRRSTRWVSMMLVIWAEWNMMINAHAFIAAQKKHTEFVLSKIENVLPHDPTSYKVIALFGSVDGDSADAAIVNSPPQMRAVVLATGVPEFWDCQVDSQACRQLKAKFEVTQESVDGGMRFVGSYDGIAVISAGR